MPWSSFDWNTFFTACRGDIWHDRWVSWKNIERTKITYESSVPNQTGHPKSCIINRARTALGVSNPPQWPKKTEQSHHGARKDFAEFFVSPKRLAHTCAKHSVTQSSPCC